MSNEQLYMAIGVPILFNGLLAIVLTSLFSGRFGDMRASLSDVRSSLEGRLGDLRSMMDSRFAGIEARMATKDELRRVEEVLDARLKHVEDELAKR